MITKLQKTLITFIFRPRTVVKQGYFMRHSLNYANTVLRCSCWKIHHYVAGLFFYFRKVAAVLQDSSKPLLFSKNEWVECWIGSREYWLIYRGPGFLAVVCFGSSPPPLPPSCQQLVSLSQSSEISAGRGWARSQIIPGRESLILCKSFNTLWLEVCWDLTKLQAHPLEK